MIKILYRRLNLLLLTCIISAGILHSQNLPEKQVPPRLVNDFAGLLSGKEAGMLEQKLVAFNDSTSVQIAIVVVSSLDGLDKSDYAQRLGEKWGIGQKGFNNGLLILIKPKTSDSRGEVFIAPGYGLEGAIPDITCAEIVDYEILPAFRSGYYYTGLDDAVNTIMSLARGEFSPAEYGEKVRDNKGDGTGIFFIVVIIIILIIISNKSGGSKRKLSTGGLPFWLLMGMMNSGRGSGGSWGKFSGGGSRGGGFGGFGGGSFGGGGAGGSW